MREFPLFTRDEPAHMVCVPRALIPLLCGQIADLERRDVWASDADWQQGYQWIVELQANLMSGCVDRIIEMQERTYRLLDTALNGAVYEVDTPATSTTLAVVFPAIPDAPDSADPQAMPNSALRSRIDRLVELVDNGLNGTVISNNPSTKASVRDNLEEIRSLLEANGTSDIGIEDVLNLILMALA